MKAAIKIKKPKLSDGSPKGYIGNHHFWYIKQYRKWLLCKETRRRTFRHFVSLVSLPIPYIVGFSGSKILNNGDKISGWILLGLSFILAFIALYLIFNWYDFDRYNRR